VWFNNDNNIYAYYTAAMQIKTHYYDVVIVGAGGAGLMASVHAAKAGLSTACITKVDPTRSHTVAAKGGMNAALGNVTPDNWRWHAYDTVRGGDWLGDQDAIEYMCKNAAAAVRELENMGVPFSRGEDGKLYQRVYGGQSSEFGKGTAPHRACAAADRTGHAILQTLYQQSLKHGAKFFIDHFALNLIMDDGVCRGVVTWDMDSGEINVFRGHVVVLATGGYGQAYATNTSSSICTGDGNAMVLRAGLPLQDMEFIQFHPTGLYGLGFLISEAARSEGAYLINGDGERFMERYAPSYLDLAPRDVIARAMATEIHEKRGCGEKKDHLLLCLQHLSADDIKKKLPSVYDSATTFLKIDPTKQPIPVVPSVHYTMGGIPTNRFCEVLNGDVAVEGLMAIGEAACVSVHGANRLGCNSLLDIIVFGKAAIDRVEELSIKGRGHKLIKAAEGKSLEHLTKLLGNSGNKSSHDLQIELKNTMSEYAGMFRNEDVLVKGCEKIKQLVKSLEDIELSDKSLIWNNELLEALELENLALQGLVTIECALNRSESRGSHFREDYPVRNDKKWLKHSIAWYKNGKVKLASRAVNMKPYSSEMEAVSPEKRKY
jgi:succinate dehydrogenase / fumarate reductase flavoprotein subunit